MGWEDGSSTSEPIGTGSPARGAAVVMFITLWQKQWSAPAPVVPGHDPPASSRADALADAALGQSAASRP